MGDRNLVFFSSLNGRTQFAPTKNFPKLIFKACIFEFSLIINYPLSIIHYQL